jgi:hypothetical protein
MAGQTRAHLAESTKWRNHRVMLWKTVFRLASGKFVISLWPMYGGKNSGWDPNRLCRSMWWRSNLRVFPWSKVRNRISEQWNRSNSFERDWERLREIKRDWERRSSESDRKLWNWTLIIGLNLFQKIETVGWAVNRNNFYWWKLFLLSHFEENLFSHHSHFWSFTSTVLAVDDKIFKNKRYFWRCPDSIEMVRCSRSWYI